MVNLGTKEGVTDKESRFAGVWTGNEAFFLAMRAKGALVGLSVDPLSSHDCGNQRYLAMPWFDACLAARLPAKNGDLLKPMSAKEGWIAPLNAGDPNVIAPVAAAKFSGDLAKSIWLPNESVATAWTQYTKDSAVTDVTPPPAPTNVRVVGNAVTWSADADLESGLASFIIERDGQFLANVPEQGQAKKSFGRPIFQNLSYSDIPTHLRRCCRGTRRTESARHTNRGCHKWPAHQVASADRAPEAAPHETTPTQSRERLTQSHCGIVGAFFCRSS